MNHSQVGSVVEVDQRGRGLGCLKILVIRQDWKQGLLYLLVITEKLVNNIGAGADEIWSCNLFY